MDRTPNDDDETSVHHNDEQSERRYCKFLNKNTNKTKRGYGRKSKRKEIKNSRNGKRKYKVSILSNNEGGIKKMESFLSTITSFDNPSCFMLQESILQSNENVCIPGYQVFMKNRKGK